MVLVDGVIELLGLAMLHAGFISIIAAVNGCRIGAAFIHGDLFWETLAADRFVQKTPRGFFIATGCPHEVNGVPGCIDRSIEFPLSFDLDVGLVKLPIAHHRTFLFVIRSLLFPKSVCVNPLSYRVIVNTVFDDSGSRP